MVYMTFGRKKWIVPTHEISHVWGQVMDRESSASVFFSVKFCVLVHALKHSQN